MHLAQTKRYLKGKWFGGGAKAEVAATTTAKGSESRKSFSEEGSLG